MDVKLPPLMRKEADQYVDIGLYESKEELIKEALRYYLHRVIGSAVDTSVELYRNKKISLGRAAEIAGVDYEGMKSILMNRSIKIRRGPKTVEEGEEEYSRVMKRLK